MKTIDVFYLRRILASALKNSYLLNGLYNTYYRLLNRKKFFEIIERRKKLSIFQYEALAAPILYYPMESVKDSNFYGQSYAIKEYARTAVDVLARRTRLSFLNVLAADEALPRIIQIMAKELNWNEKKQKV